MTATLEFIIGRAGTGKTHACLMAMKDALTREPLGRQRILLVPEHMTYAGERALAEVLTSGAGFLQAYVFGFRRFARQVLLETGGVHLPRISDIGMRILLKDILIKRAGDLSAFARSVHKRGFTETLGSTIAELKRYRIHPDILRAAADRSSTGRLPQKLADLSIVMEELAARMEGRYTDQTDRMERLAWQLGTASFLRDAEIWVDGFDFFNPQELAVFRALFHAAGALHVTLTMEGRCTDGAVRVNLPENTRETGLFSRGYRAMRDLEQILAEIDPQASASIRLMEEQRRTAQLSLAEIETRLFGHGQLSPCGDGALRLVEAANPRLEMEAAAADILRLTREQGYRYREIAVFVRDMPCYAELLTLTFADYGIPCYLDAKRPSTHHPLAELLRAAARTAWRGWDYETMFRALRTGFFPVLGASEEETQVLAPSGDWQEAVDRLENYCLAYGIRTQRQWTATEDWDFARRAIAADAYESEDNAARIAEEEAIDAVRRRIAAPLALLKERLSRAQGTARTRTQALYELLTELDVPRILETWRTAADAEGRLADAAAHRQIWTSCMNLFDQMVETGGDEEISAHDYEEILGDGLDALDIALIPPGLDHVTIASFDQNSLAGIRAVYIVGANAGTMPRAGAQQGVLSDAERLSMNEMFHALHEGAAPEIFGGGREQSFLERYRLYRGFTAAREYLWVSYALAGSDGSALSPSPIIARLRRLEPSFLSIPLATVEREDALVLAAQRPALSALSGALLGQKERGDMRPLWRDVYNWMRDNEEMRPPLRLMVGGLFAHLRETEIPPAVAVRLFAPHRRIAGSTTRLETFRACPFSHFAKYGLALREREVYEFQNNDFGTLLHGILRGYGEWVRAAHGNDWSAAAQEGEEKIDELLAQIVPQVRSAVLLSRASYRHRVERIRRTARQVIRRLTAWAAASEFRPQGFEVGFGGHDGVRIAEFPLAGGMTLSLRGQIDRYDVSEDGAYYIVLDYKTGTVSLELPEIRHGLKMQLLLYLYVVHCLLRDGAPAGMLYAPAANPLIEPDIRLDDDALQGASAKKSKLTGFLIDDMDVIRRIDALTEHLCVSITGKNAFSKASEKYLRVREEFESLLKFLPQLVRETAEEILSGRITAAPYRFKQRTACAFCAYRVVCGFAPELGDGYRDIPNDAQAAMEEITDAVREEGDTDGE